MSRTGAGLAVVLLFATLSPLHGQWRSAPESARAPVPAWAEPEVDLARAVHGISFPRDSAEDEGGGFGTTFLAASAGSLVGGIGGVYAGRGVHELTGCCGIADYPGFGSAIVGGLIGSTAGAVLGSEVARSDDSLGRAITGALIGIGTGLATVAVLDHAGFPSPWIGYGVGQGFTTAIATSPTFSR